MAICPNCGNQTGEGAIFCDQCGARLSAPEAAAPEMAPAPAGGSVICAACGAGNVPGEAFCDFCGSPLEAPVPTADVVPELEPVSMEAELEVEPTPATAEEEPSPGEAGAKPSCPACGAEVVPGEAFCADCGASLAQPPIPPEPVPEEEPEPVVVAAEPEPTPPPEPEPVAEQVEAEPVVEAATPPPPAPEAPSACPACGVEVEAGDRFCSNCGAVLEAAPAPAEEEVVPVPHPPSGGPRLVVVESGAEIPLPTGEEILIGREDPVSGVFPDIDLTPHGGESGGVSRRHARLVVEAGDYFIEDLDSTNFTFVNKQKLAPKTRHPLGDGDEIRCGRVTLVLKTG